MADPRLVCEQLHTLLQSEAERRLDNDFVYRMLEMGFDNACRIDIVEHMSKTLERFEGAGANRIYLTVAVMQMDQYLARASVSEMGELYALAGACMLLTSKFVGTRALHAASLAEFMFQPDAERLLAMETQVLTVLRWRLQMPTPHDFIKIFSDNLQLYLPQRPDTNAALVESACAIADICCSDLNCVVFGPSVVAVVSIYWAATGYGTETGEPLLAMTKKDRQSLFGLRHLFAEREAVVAAAMSHIEGILVIGEGPSRSAASSAAVSPSAPHPPMPEAGSACGAAAGAYAVQHAPSAAAAAATPEPPAMDDGEDEDEEDEDYYDAQEEDEEEEDYNDTSFADDDLEAEAGELEIENDAVVRVVPGAAARRPLGPYELYLGVTQQHH